MGISETDNLYVELVSSAKNAEFPPLTDTSNLPDLDPSTTGPTKRATSTKKPNLFRCPVVDCGFGFTKKAGTLKCHSKAKHMPMVVKYCCVVEGCK